MSAPLASGAELDLYVGAAVDPPRAALVLQAASGVVTGYCGWSIVQETVTMAVNGKGGQVLELPTLKLTALNTLAVDGISVDLTAADAPRATLRGHLVWGAGWPCDSLIEAGAPPGYAAAPDVVTLVTLSLASRILNNPDDATVVTVSSVSRRYDRSLSALDMRLLDPYRI